MLKVSKLLDQKKEKRTRKTTLAAYRIQPKSGSKSSELERVGILRKQLLHPLRKTSDRKGKGYIAAPACGGSLAEAKYAYNQTSPI
eukprot:437953-Pelagomonas_calceolata.AAC.3